MKFVFALLGRQPRLFCLAFLLPLVSFANSIAVGEQVTYTISGILPPGSSNHPDVADGEIFAMTLQIDLAVPDANPNDATEGRYANVSFGKIVFSGGYEIDGFADYSTVIANNQFNSPIDAVSYSSQGSLGFLITVANDQVNPLATDELPGIGFSMTTDVRADFYSDIDCFRILRSEGDISFTYGEDLGTTFTVSKSQIVPNTLIRVTGVLPPGSSDASDYVNDGESFEAMFFADRFTVDQNSDSTFGRYDAAVMRGHIEFSGGFFRELPTRQQAVGVRNNLGVWSDGIFLYSPSNPPDQPNSSAYLGVINDDSSLIESIAFPQPGLMYSHSVAADSPSQNNLSMILSDGENVIDFRASEATQLSIEFEDLARVPGQYLIARGVQVSGDEQSLAESDNIDLVAQRRANDLQARVFFEFSSISPLRNPLCLSFKLEGSVFARRLVNQNIDLFNYETEAWEQVDTRAASRFSDSTAEVDAIGDLSRYIEPTTLEVRARVRYESASQRQRFSASVDQATWTIY